MIFLDAGFLFAHVSEDDANYARVEEVLEAHRGQRLSALLLTTNHVIAETITLVRTRGHRDPRVRHEIAVKVGERLFAGAFGKIHQVTAEEERAAFAYFSKYSDKQYSFVDCVSFVIMEKLDIEVAWTVDGDFRHRFTALPGPIS